MISNSVANVNNRAVEIIAHRGASHDAPENTLAAIRLGWEQEADAVEIDIHLSKDGHIVVLHDKTTKRIGELDEEVAAQTLEELQRLDYGSWKDARFAGEKIPTLDEVIATMPDDVTKRLVIEIKCGPEVIPALQAVLEQSGKPAQQFLIIGSPYHTLKAAKHALPRHEAYWLGEYHHNKDVLQYPLSLDQLIKLAQEAKFDALNLNFNVLFELGIEPIQAAGLKCYAWTVDTADEARRLVAAGIDGITTNRPLWLRQQLAASEVAK